MVQMEIEITDEQLEKVKELEEHGIGIGDAIDMLFEIKEKTLTEIETLDDEKIDVLAKMKGSLYDYDKKADALGENFGETEKDYKMQANEIKSKVSWAKDIFSF